MLHGYIEKTLVEASKQALELGQELLAAKKATPPGGWEEACERLFTPSPRTAQRYMQFAKHMEALPKTTNCRILFLEGTFDGAAKAAKKAAKPKPPKPKPDEPINVDFEPADEPEEPAKKKPKPPKNKPPKKLDKNALYKEWDKAIGPLIRTLNKIASDVGEKNGPSHRVILGQLDACTEEMGEWMQVKS